MHKLFLKMLPGGFLQAPEGESIILPVVGSFDRSAGT